jgi:hypothetical protein
LLNDSDVSWKRSMKEAASAFTGADLTVWKPVF